MSGHEILTVTPLTPRIGAEVSGVALGDDLDDGQEAAIRAALLAHQVIFFRDQEMSVERHKDLGRCFGELDIHPGIPGPEGHPEILHVYADAETTRIAGEDWHSDVSCELEPPMGSILHMHEVPPSGGDTLFASMTAAHDALSEPMRNFLGGLTARHSGEYAYRGRYVGRGIDDTGAVYPEADHPVVRTHPETGAKGLFVNRIFTRRINGVSAAESAALLDFLFEHVARPEFQVRFRWQAGSVAFWDNRCVQHMAMWDYFPQVRSGYRVTIKGDRPV